MSVLASLLAAPVAAAAPPERTPPPVQVTKPVPVTEVASAPARPLPSPPARPAAVQWPAPGQTDLEPGRAGGSAGRAGDLPVEASPTGQADPGPVRVSLLERRSAETAHLDGPLLVVERSESAAGAADGLELSVGYGAFGDLRGGDWASRLRLVQVPDCALTTPTDPGCQPTPLPSRNDPASQTVTAVLPAPTAEGNGEAEPTGPARSGDGGAPSGALSTTSTMVALSAGASGSAGDYTATSLSASSAWQVGQQTGDFTWSYPMRVPPGTGGPTPDLTIGYSSGSVDGRTSSTNNQPSWVGEGHDLTTGHVERKYTPCADDMTGGSNTARTGDLCWNGENATLVFAGRSSDLVRDDTTGAWRLKNDDGSRIERLHGATNGDNDTEYWRLTTTDGVQYHFGLGRRSAGDPENTNSTWTVPVFGNHPGEPCRGATFAASSCQQAWRWNLDYVADLHGNTMTYHYTAETNHYGRNLNTAVSTYTRGGHLARIDYGQRRGSEHTASAPARTVFTVAERCLPSGAITCAPEQLTAANASHWPDVPQDRICASATSCPNQFSPTFFSRKRLTGITTQTWNGSGYTDVDAWQLTHEFKDPGDGTSKSLWLASIAHTGKVGGSITLPSITFAGTQRPNRVDGLDTAPPLVKWRVSSVTTDTGATVSVNYSPQDCTPTDKPASPETNTRRCFPVYWAEEGATSPTLHYFHKYLVTSVVTGDGTGGSPALHSNYDYLGAPAWHYDETLTVPTKYRTYGQWRGYGTVDLRTGGAGDPQTHERTLFMRGMHDDPLPGGGRRTVTVTDADGGTLQDHPRLSGFVREHQTFNGVNGPLVGATVNDPWISAATATGPNGTAHMVATASTRSRTPLAAGGLRRTQTSTTYDSHGMPTSVNDLADTGTAADDTCTTITYARNTTAWLLDPVARAETVSKACGAAVTRPADVVSDERHSYDGGAFGATPTEGNLTRTETLDGWANGPVYATTATATYDSHGRPLTAADALSRTTTTAYTPATGGPVTATTVTNPAGHAATTNLSPHWGLPLSTIDANNRRTDLTYDPLGRLTAVWTPDRNKAAGATAKTTFEYLVRNNGPVAVATRNLRNNGTYTTTWALYDSLMRPRQTQAPAPGSPSNRVLTDTVYDSHGWTVAHNGPYYALGAPASTLVTAAENSLPAQTRTGYDLAGRPVSSSFRVNGTEKWATTTSYGGDRVHVDPPSGDTPTTTITDGRGRTTELRQYTGPSPTGTYDATTYAYTPAGQVSAMTDTVGNRWTYGYDLRGRQTAATDPDKGTTTTAYDLAGQVVTTTDARGTVLARTYDSLGRQTSLRDGTTTGPLRASWTYDTLAKGQPTAATRHNGGNAYTSAVTGYDAMYRPTGTSTTIPAVEGALAGTYTTANTYNVDGGLRTHQLPAAAGLTAERLTYNYDTLGLPVALGGNGSYVAGTTYSPYGQVLQHTLGALGKTVWQTFDYEEGSRRLQRIQLDRETVPTADSRTDLSWDPAGNLTSLSDPLAPSGGDLQCFAYDYLRRLTEAWTPTASAGCAAARSASSLAGPAPYWHSYGYDKAGNRTSHTRRTPTATATTTSTFPTPGATAVRPHAPLSTTGTGTGAVTGSHGYDPAGNTTTRPTTAGAQTLTWTAEGQLGSATTTSGPAGTTSFLYDAGGQRLIRRDPGATTLYLGGTEIRLDTATGTRTSTRHYRFNGATVAVRTAAGMQILTADHHGTAGFAVHSSTHALTVRRSLPFGETRGTQPAWPGEKGFVGGTNDTSAGLTQLGARPYDSLAGRFLSVDPVQDPFDPQQWNAYAYANNNPTTWSDPTGLDPRPNHNFADPNRCAGNACGHAAQTKEYGSPQPKPPVFVPARPTAKFQTPYTPKPSFTASPRAADGPGPKSSRPAVGFLIATMTAGPAAATGPSMTVGEALILARSRTSGVRVLLNPLGLPQQDVDSHALASQREAERVPEPQPGPGMVKRALVQIDQHGVFTLNVCRGACVQATYQDRHLTISVGPAGGGGAGAGIGFNSARPHEMGPLTTFGACAQYVFGGCGQIGLRTSSSPGHNEYWRGGTVNFGAGWSAGTTATVLDVDFRTGTLSYFLNRYEFEVW